MVFDRASRYFDGCRGVAGAVAGTSDPANASQAGFVAGQAIVASNRLYIAIVALVIAVVGTIKEKLPGTMAHA